MAQNDVVVMAVEERAEAEVQTATLQRRLDDLRDQVATHTEHLVQAQAQNRQLLAELEMARAEMDEAANRSPADESRPLWKPMHLQPLYEGCRRVGGAVSEALFEQGLCLPSGSSLSTVDQQRIIALIRATPGAAL